MPHTAPARIVTLGRVSALAVATFPLVVPQLRTSCSRSRRVHLFAVGVLFSPFFPAVIMYAFVPTAGVASLRPSVVRLGHARPVGSPRCYVFSHFDGGGGVWLVCEGKSTGTHVVSLPRVGVGTVLTSSLLSDGWSLCACVCLIGAVSPQATVSQRSFTGAKAPVAVRARRARVTPYVRGRVRRTCSSVFVLGVIQSSRTSECGPRSTHVSPPWRRALAFQSTTRRNKPYCMGRAC